MKRNQRKITHLLNDFFNGIVDVEAKRVNEFNSRVFENRNIKEVNKNMYTMSNIHKDFLASNIRSQINRLRDVLINLETENSLDRGYANGALKDIEVNLRQIRKLCQENN
jgi:exonuclease VII large subunit